MSSGQPSLAHADNDRGALRCWQEWEISGRDRRIVLCVETALELRPGRPGFDRALLDDLIEHANGLVRSNPGPIDALRIVPSSALGD